MSEFAALAYLEWRQIVNFVRKTVRQPGRAVLYGILLLYLAFIVYLRIRRVTVFVGGGAPGVPEPLASIILLVFIAVCGLRVISAAGGNVGVFSSFADARFLIGSRLSERGVVLWLQMRKSWRLLARLLFLILFYAVVLNRGGSFGGMALSMAAGTVLVAALDVPALKFARRFGARIAYTVGGLLVAIGVVPVVILTIAVNAEGIMRLALGHAALRATPVESWIEHLGFGHYLSALVAGNPTALAVLYGISIVTVVSACLGATDLYPELYAGSIRWIERMARRRTSPFGRTRYAAVVHEEPTRSGLLRGAWALLWKDWIGFRRASGRTFWFVAGLIAGVAAGAGIGFVARQAGSFGEALAASAALAFSLGNILIIFVALYAATAFAEDLRKPIWWMNADSLRARLYVWTLGATWRLSLPIALAFITWSVVLRSAAFAIVAAPAAVVFIVYLRAIGLGLYSLFPSATDQRGPVAVLRLFLTYVMLAPPAVAGGVIGFFTHSVPAGTVVGVALVFTEIALCLELARARISTAGMSFAQAEAS